MNGREILFLAHRVPFPPDRGDKIRSHHVLKALARMAPVHVGCFAENEADAACAAELDAVADSWCMPARTMPLVQAGLAAVCSAEPVSMAAFRNPELSRWVKETLAARDIGAMYVFSGQMGQYVPMDWQGRVVLDLVDVDSAKFEALAQTASWPMSWIYHREARLLRAEEARMALAASQTLLVSAQEAELLRQRMPARAPAHIGWMGNGIDSDAFDPAAIAPHPALRSTPGPHLVFTGQMDYPPNVDAALYVIRDILPLIRRTHPDAAFHVVGRAPVRALAAHDGRAGCRIWGSVPDVRPFLAAADIVLAPLRIARGVQNKILEAMSMARPVILSPGAATGIPATDGEHFAVAEGVAHIAERALEMLCHPEAAEQMGLAARRYVQTHMNWPAIVSHLSGIVGLDMANGRCRDAA